MTSGRQPAEFAGPDESPALLAAEISAALGLIGRAFAGSGRGTLVLPERIALTYESAGGAAAAPLVFVVESGADGLRARAIEGDEHGR